MRVDGQTLTLRQAQQKTGNWITGEWRGVVRLPRSFVVLEGVAWRSISTSQDRELEESQFSSETQRMPPLGPGNTVGKYQAIGIVKIVVTRAEAQIWNRIRAAVELKCWKYLPGRIPDSKLLGPVRSVHTRTNTCGTEAIQAYDEVVQYGRTSEIVPTVA